MRRSLYFFILQLSLMTVLSVWSSQAVSTRAHGKKKSVKKINLCDIERQEAPIFCYCGKDNLQNITGINCVVLNKFKPNDEMWSYFGSHIYLQKLTFNVRYAGNLDYIPTQLLQQLTNLRTIAFHANIQELVEHTFSNLTGLSEINLSRNLIVTLCKHAFENMRNLTLINLDDNRISEINRDIFLNLPALRTLHLNRNNISILHDKAFKQLGSLQELQLNDNKITVVTRDSFHGLRNLLRLDLRNNLISMIGERSFVEMPELAELELDKNKITFISGRALDGMRNLRKLRLSGNRLMMLEPDILAGAPGVYFLDLRDNALKTMTFDNIKPIITNLYGNSSHFYLDNNELICDCKLTWIWGLRNETKNTKLRDALEELTCFLESNNATFKINSENLERNQTLGVTRNFKEYLPDNPRDENDDEDDPVDYYDEPDEENSSLNLNVHDKYHSESKVCCIKHLFELKPEELPCPEQSREDLMASEQPSSRHENARVGLSGSVWFSSSAKTVQPVFAASLLPLLFILFT